MRCPYKVINLLLSDFMRRLALVNVGLRAVALCASPRAKTACLPCKLNVASQQCFEVRHQQALVSTKQRAGDFPSAEVEGTCLGRQRLAVQVAATGAVGSRDVEAGRARRQPPDAAQLLARRLAQADALVTPVILRNMRILFLMLCREGEGGRHTRARHKGSI